MGESKTPVATLPTHIDFSRPLPPTIEPLPSYILDLTDTEREEPYLLFYKGAGMLPRKDIQALLGERKSGKTTLARVFVVALLRGEYLGFKTKDEAGLKVLIADTEQSPHNVERNTRRIHSAVGVNPYRNNPDLLVLQLRQFDKGERLRILCDEVERFCPDFVLLDGIVDVCQDFNDAKESGKTITSIMRLSVERGCAILCVMHFNKDGETARGHLGAELLNKCSEGYEVTRNGNHTEVTPKYGRNDSISPFGFEVTTDGESEQIAVIDCRPQTKQDREKTELQDLMRQVFDKGEPMRSTDIVDAITDILDCSKRTAKAKQARAYALKIIDKDATRLYTLQELQDFKGIPTKDLQDDEDII